ncbi:MAG: DUF5610 domain-containing protein [Gallionella sp.]
MMKVESIGQGVPTARIHPEGRPEAVERRAPEPAKSGVDASKQAYNTSILKASMEVSLSAGNHSMSLLFKSAIEHLNEVLAPELGDNAIQAAAESGMDFSPQATADRIVSMSTAFFGRYAENHSEKDLNVALVDFVQLIRGGIDKGFAEAREILDGLKVLEGDIASNIDKTYELVQFGLKAFVENHSRLEQTNAVSENPAGS